jgi:integrase
MPEAREIFLRAKREEEENRRLCGKGYQENDFIFKWPEGTPFSPDYVSSHFALLLKNNGLPHIRFHELRHSCASLLLNSGFTLKDVQEYMGYSDIQMTANIYGHLDTQRKNLLTEKITASIF